MYSMIIAWQISFKYDKEHFNMCIGSSYTILFQNKFSLFSLCVKTENVYKACFFKFSFPDFSAHTVSKLENSCPNPGNYVG